MGRPRKRQKLSTVAVSGLVSPEPEEDLEQTRRRNEQKLQGRFAAIYAKFGRDFTGISDEIDNSTGAIVVDNGHLRNMRHERDIGHRHRRAEPDAQKESANDVEDELALDEEDSDAASDCDSERDGPFDSIWSDPDILNTTQTSASETLASEVVQAAVPPAQYCDFTDPSFVNTFSLNIMKQVAQVMQTFQGQQMRQITAGPSVLKQQSEHKRSKPSTYPRPSRVSADHGRPEHSETISSDLFDFVDAGQDASPAQNVSSVPGMSEQRSTARVLGHGRGRGPAYTAEEDDTIMTAFAAEQIDWKQLKTRLPHRTIHALSNRMSQLRRLNHGDMPSVKRKRSGRAFGDFTPPETSPQRDSSSQSPMINDRTAGNTGISLREEPPSLEDSRKSKPRKRRSKGETSWTREEDDYLMHLRKDEGYSWRHIATLMPKRTKRACQQRFFTEKSKLRPEVRLPELDIEEPRTGSAAEEEATEQELDHHGELIPSNEQETSSSDQLETGKQLVVSSQTPKALYDEIEVIPERTRSQRRICPNPDRQTKAKRGPKAAAIVPTSTAIILDEMQSAEDMATPTAEEQSVPDQDSPESIIDLPKRTRIYRTRKHATQRRSFSETEDNIIRGLEPWCLHWSAYRAIANGSRRNASSVRNRHLLHIKLGRKLEQYDATSEAKSAGKGTGVKELHAQGQITQDGLVEVVPPGYVIEILDSEDEGEVSINAQSDVLPMLPNTKDAEASQKTTHATNPHHDQLSPAMLPSTPADHAPSSPALPALIPQTASSGISKAGPDDEDELGQESADLTSSFIISSSSTALVRKSTGSSPLIHIAERNARLNSKHDGASASKLGRTNVRLLTPVSSSPRRQLYLTHASSPGISDSSKLRSVKQKASRMIMPAMSSIDLGEEDELA